jgi:drug/metabolite transporter (DMT)-like permease
MTDFGGYSAGVSLLCAVPFAVGAAVVYGTSIVVQHRAAHTGTGVSDARHLLTLLRNPVWVFAVLGDFIGFLLGVVALSMGPVVFVQPIVVLMLPVSLLVSSLMGGPSPRRGDYLGCAAVIVGLGVFLLLIGDPGHEHVPRARHIGMVVLLVLVIGIVLCLVVLATRPVIRGAVFGAVAGAYFGTVGVMIDAISDHIGKHGVSSLFTSPRGLVPLAGLILLGLAGIILTQLSFQIGALGATLPANTAADPCVAVILGAVLLHERFPLSPWHVVAYTLCLAAIVAGAIRLAAPVTGPIEVAAEEAQPASVAHQ